MSGNGNYMLESNIEWRQEKLVAHINQLNSNAQDAMRNNPDLWIGMLTNDLNHWAEYGIYSVDDLENYLDACCDKELRNGESI